MERGYAECKNGSCTETYRYPFRGTSPRGNFCSSSCRDTFKLEYHKKVMSNDNVYRTSQTLGLTHTEAIRWLKEYSRTGVRPELARKQKVSIPV